MPIPDTGFGRQNRTVTFPIDRLKLQPTFPVVECENTFQPPSTLTTHSGRPPSVIKRVNLHILNSEGAGSGNTIQQVVWEVPLIWGVNLDPLNEGRMGCQGDRHKAYAGKHPKLTYTPGFCKPWFEDHGSRCPAEHRLHELILGLCRAYAHKTPHLKWSFGVWRQPSLKFP